MKYNQTKLTFVAAPINGRISNKTGDLFSEKSKDERFKFTARKKELRALLKTSKRICKNLPAGRQVRFIRVYLRPIYFKNSF